MIAIPSHIWHVSVQEAGVGSKLLAPEPANRKTQFDKTLGGQKVFFDNWDDWRPKTSATQFFFDIATNHQGITFIWMQAKFSTLTFKKTMYKQIFIINS